MKTNNYNLQLLHHEEVFATRELALKYLADFYKPYSLEAEPVIVKYGDIANPDVILAFGTSDAAPGSFYVIDMTKANEQIEDLVEKFEQDKGELDNIAQRLNEVVIAAGFDVDENKITNKITYKPDRNDDVIGTAVSIAESVDLLSKYVQSGFADNKLSVEDTKSVRLVYSVNPNGGKTLKAGINISTDGDSDELGFNNNIIGIKTDGLYAAAHLRYDDVRHELIFTTSGYKNGRFQDDAIVQRINLGEHIKLVADNENHTVKLTISENESNYTTTLSADVQISSNEDNILEIKDNKLAVIGRAKNIKYGDSNVAIALNNHKDKLNELETKVESSSKSAHIEGGQTDTLETVINTLSDGGAKVTGNVRLGSANSIVVRNGGLEANITIDVDTSSNKLIATIGNQTVEKVLPGVELFQSAEYNDDNEELIITFKTGNTLVIPIHDIIHTWETRNNQNSPITLTKTTVTGGVDTLSGSLELRSTDNLLGIENGKLYASENLINTKIANETTRATNAEITLQNNISALQTDVNSKFETQSENISDVRDSVITEKERATEAETEIRGKAEHADELAKEAKQLANEANATVISVSEGLTETNANLAALTTTVNEYKADTNTKFSETNANVSSNTNAINNLTSTLANERTERTNADVEINGIINTVKDSVVAETQRAGAAEVALGERITTLSDKEAHDIEDVRHLIEDETARAKSAENANAVRIEEVNEKINEGSTETLGQAKAYTDSVVLTEENARKAKDTEIETSIANAVRDASDDATAKANTAKLEANNYTDNKVSTEALRAKAAEEANANAITSLTTEVNKKIEEVTIEKNSDLQYFINVDGVKVGEINIPKDQFFKSASYDSELKIITLTFIVADGEQSVQLNVSDLVDTYTAGNGLSVSNNKFEVKLNQETESYLVLNEDGLGVFGIDAALATKANVGDFNEIVEKVNIINGNAALEGSFAKGDANTLSSAKSYTDEKTNIIVNSLENEIVRAKAAEKVNSDAIEILNANKANVGVSYTKEESDAKYITEHQSLVEYAKQVDVDNLTTKVTTNENAIAIINGNEATDGSISKSLKDAKIYTDSKIAEVNNVVNTKANSSDVYTKTEIDNKGYLTEHQDISDLENGITELNTTVNDIKFITKESDTVNVTMDKQTGDEYRTLSADVKLKTISGTENANIIKKDANGLYATVTFNYDKISNSITFNDGNGDKTFELNNFGILQDAIYESATKSIVLIIKKDDETTDRITIPVADLVNTWSVENKSTSPVVLEKISGENGDILSADISILNDSHNLLVKQNGSLFADADSNKHIALWGTEQTTVQGVINILKERTNEIDSFKQDIDDLETDNQNIKAAIATYQTDLNNQKDKIIQNENAIANLEQRQSQLENDFENLSLRVDTFDSRITEAQKKATEAETIVNQLKEKLGDIQSNEDTVAERLNRIEDAISKLIDFGEYNIEF